MMVGVAIKAEWQVPTERVALEEKLHVIARSPRAIRELNLDAFFATMLQVAEYNARHPDDPIRPVR